MPIPERLKPSFGNVTAPELDPMDEAARRLIVALDVSRASQAAELVNRLERNCRWFKVGMELFTAAGPAAIEPLVSRGHSVFLDLKYCDIPNTVAGAVRSAAGLGVRLVTSATAGRDGIDQHGREADWSGWNPPLARRTG